MKWLLRAKPFYRLWFLRGIADSDGSVNVRNGAVVITSSPNTDLFYSIFITLGIKANRWFSDGTGYVGIRAVDAYALRIFNPIIATHRGNMLEKLALARTYPAHWPNWFDAKEKQFLSDGRDCASIRDTLLNDYRVYVKLKTLTAKSTILEKAGAAL